MLWEKKIQKKGSKHQDRCFKEYLKEHSTGLFLEE